MLHKVIHVLAVRVRGLEKICINRIRVKGSCFLIVLAHSLQGRYVQRN